MLSREGRPTGLGEAFAHDGRIFKTLHLLQFLHDEPYRRMIGAQLNVSESRHALARKICFGNRGELRQRYRQGLEDQLGALGLVLNAVVWWNSLYIDAAVTRLHSEGFPAIEEMCARLSPLGFDHINFLGSHTFSTDPTVETCDPCATPTRATKTSRRSRNLRSCRRSAPAWRRALREGLPPSRHPPTPGRRRRRTRFTEPREVLRPACDHTASAGRVGSVPWPPGPAGPTPPRCVGSMPLTGPST
jgi:hypothetical protein